MQSQFLPCARPRAATIDLEWPVVIDGVEYRTITLIRLTAGEVEAAIKKAREGDENAPFRLPVFRDAGGAPLSDAVLAALDDDDVFRLDEAARDFFPRRFRAATDSGSTRDPSATTAPSSAAGSAGA